MHPGEALALPSGNRYLRTLLIHGARAALASVSRLEIALGGRLRALLTRAHRSVVIVALAAKLARIAWVSLRQGADYEPTWGQSVKA